MKPEMVEWLGPVFFWIFVVTVLLTIARRSPTEIRKGSFADQWPGLFFGTIICLLMLSLVVSLVSHPRDFLTLLWAFAFPALILLIGVVVHWIRDQKVQPSGKPTSEIPALTETQRIPTVWGEMSELPPGQARKREKRIKRGLARWQKKHPIIRD